MTITKSVVLSILCAVFFSAASAVGAQGVANHDLPAGFSIPGNLREDVGRRRYWEFDSIQYNYLPANAKSSVHTKVEGHLWRVAVAALQTSNNADVLITGFAGDLQKQGWTILRGQGTLVAHRAGGGHDLWLNGSGNSGDFRLELVEAAPPARSLTLKPPQAQVETVGDNQELPYAPPLPGSKPEKTIYDHRAIDISLPNAKERSYGIPALTRWYDEPPGVSSYEFAALYRSALESAGWDVVRTNVGGDSVVLAHYVKSGRDVWLYTRGDGVKQNIDVVDYGAETKASSLRQQLAKEGHVALYGIYFDTDSAVPRPESEATLQNVLQMLKTDASLKLEVQGHTDNTGAVDHNATLSDARAASVKTWLVRHGVPPASLTSKGYGATKPVADNNSAEGKAKNRRVELVKL